jgi:hypothetical protein
MRSFARGASIIMDWLRRVCGRTRVSVSSPINHPRCMHQSLGYNAQANPFVFHSLFLLRPWPGRPIEYVCPKCGHFNASANSKKSGSVSTPTSPTAIPSHMRPDRGLAFVPPTGTPLQESVSRLRRRHIGDQDEDADADKGDTSVMEVDS